MARQIMCDCGCGQAVEGTNAARGPVRVEGWGFRIRIDVEREPSEPLRDLREECALAIVGEAEAKQGAVKAKGRLRKLG